MNFDEEAKRVDGEARKAWNATHEYSDVLACLARMMKAIYEAGFEAGATHVSQVVP